MTSNNTVEKRLSEERRNGLLMFRDEHGYFILYEDRNGIIRSNTVAPYEAVVEDAIDAGYHAMGWY